MTDFVVFTLAGPMASFGTVAGNERRGTESRPGHSMLVGLIAAALGLRRNEAEELTRLSDACKFAVRVDCPGHLITDYHTVQSAKRNKKIAEARTRRQMLLEGDRTTIVTRREYLMDIRFTVAAAFTHHRITAEELVQCLKQPRLALYLGRKSCPPALPFNPKLVRDADHIESTFHSYDQLTLGSAACFWEKNAVRRRAYEPGEITIDARLGTSASSHRRERRRVRPIDRGTWRFDTLDELVLATPARGLPPPANGDEVGEG